MPKPTTDWQALYEEASDAIHQAYHDLLKLAGCLDDRPHVQKRIWEIANELLRHQ